MPSISALKKSYQLLLDWSTYICQRFSSQIISSWFLTNVLCSSVFRKLFVLLFLLHQTNNMGFSCFSCFQLLCWSKPMLRFISGGQDAKTSPSSTTKFRQMIIFPQLCPILFLFPQVIMWYPEQLKLMKLYSELLDILPIFILMREHPHLETTLNLELQHLNAHRKDEDESKTQFSLLSFGNQNIWGRETNSSPVIWLKQSLVTWI